MSETSRMKLWLITPQPDLPEETSPWEPWYNKAFGFVVRAKTEADARQIASGNAGEETRSFPHRRTGQSDAWENPTLSRCVELHQDGKKGLVLRDFHAA